MFSVDHVLGPIYLAMANNGQFREKIYNSPETTDKFLATTYPLFEQSAFDSLVLEWVKFNIPLLPGVLNKKKKQKVPNVQFDLFGNLLQINAQFQPIQTRTLQCTQCPHHITLWEDIRKPLALTYIDGSFQEVLDHNLLLQQSELSGKTRSEKQANTGHFHCKQMMLQITTLSPRNKILFLDLDSVTSNLNNTFQNIDHFQDIKVENDTYTILNVIHSKHGHFTTTFKIQNQTYFYDDKVGHINPNVPNHIPDSRLAAAVYLKAEM